jgi:hypothetical protein
MAEEFQHGVDPISPQPSGHGVLLREPFQNGVPGRVLGGQEEIVVFLQEGSVDADQHLPMLLGQLVFRVGLLFDVFHAPLFHHD